MRILVLADSHRHFTYWCGQQEPPENPNDRKFYVITPDTLRRGTRGVHRQEGDRLIRLNSAPYDWPGHWEPDPSNPGQDRYVGGWQLADACLMPGGWDIATAERQET